MVEKSIMAVKLKKDGERELTIVDPVENDDDIMNCTLVDCEDSSEDDDKDDEDDLADSAVGAADFLYIYEHDEFMVQGLMGLVDMTEVDNL
jgi:hypothetical protein